MTISGDLGISSIVSTARAALTLITDRGYDRGRMLIAELQSLLTA